MSRNRTSASGKAAARQRAAAAVRDTLTTRHQVIPPVNHRQAERVLKIARARGVKFIRIWFTDILGQLKSFAINDQELAGALREGMGFDGSSIEGFARIEESDLIALPDPSTFAILPWRPGEHAAARMFCDIRTPDGQPYAGDTRWVLKRMLAQAAKRGWTFQLGPELEYFYFKNDVKPEPIDAGGYFDTVPLDEAQDLRRDTILYLEKMGIRVEYSHHEVAPSQHEIDLRHAEALAMADTVVTYKVVVKQVAHAKGLYASFMPKPIAWVNGSGMHVHMSLFEGKRNVFFDAKDPQHLSKTARHFMGGILAHARDIAAVTNQWVNSYKRLVPRYEAPVYVGWAQRNRSALVRVPMYKPGKEGATRIEARFPDPGCNPYLAFAVLLAAGLDGIDRKSEPGAPVEADIYHMDDAERKRRGIEALPGSLIEALELAKGSGLLKQALGEHVFAKFIANKAIEWDRFRSQVTDWEVEKYLPIL